MGSNCDALIVESKLNVTSEVFTQHRLPTTIDIQQIETENNE